MSKFKNTFVAAALLGLSITSLPLPHAPITSKTLGQSFSISAAHAGARTKYKALRNYQDRYLQKTLEKMVKDQELEQAIKNKKLTISLTDITDINNPRLAMLNGDEMIYAASLPKLAILLAAFVQIDSGVLKPDDALWNDITNMIRHSSNSAATRVIKKVGKNKLLDILRAPRFKLYDSQYNGGLWVGKLYEKSPAYQRDPLHNISHGATAFQVARFYYLLETGQIARPDLTQKMKMILSNSAINHKFKKGLSQYPDAKIYRKSGSWRQYHADSALVEFKGRKYIIVGLAVSPQGGKWLQKLAAPLHELAVAPFPQPANKQKPDALSLNK